MADYSNVPINVSAKEIEKMVLDGIKTVENINVWESPVGIFKVMGKAFLTQASADLGEEATENFYQNSGDGLILIVTNVTTSDKDLNNTIYTDKMYVVILVGVEMSGISIDMSPIIRYGYTDGNIVRETTVENISNKVNFFESNKTSDKKYPTTKAVADYVSSQISAIQTNLPEVTAEDNGKFLGVVDGAWGLISISTTEGVEY